MCMYLAKTENLDKLDNIAYKIVCVGYPNAKYYTPFMWTGFNKRLIAKGLPHFRPTEELGIALSGGAIHCYRDNKNIKLNYDEIILKVKGYNPIAYNEKEIAFKGIEVIEEL